MHTNNQAVVGILADDLTSAADGAGPLAATSAPRRNDRAANPLAS